GAEKNRGKREEEGGGGWCRGRGELHRKGEERGKGRVKEEEEEEKERERYRKGRHCCRRSPMERKTPPLPSFAEETPQWLGREVSRPLRLGHGRTRAGVGKGEREGGLGRAIIWFNRTRVIQIGLTQARSRMNRISRAPGLRPRPIEVAGSRLASSPGDFTEMMVWPCFKF
ncbi:hypothetical protein B296_00041276, partial [Ensete ventricosum]